MKDDNGALRFEELPFAIGEILGEVQTDILLIPGVHYLIVKQPDRAISDEYYVVARNASDISDAAKGYGVPFPNHSEWLLFSVRDNDSWHILEYEICRYKVQHQIPLPEGQPIQELAAFGREKYPEYFGAYPAPLLTPWGPMLRYKTIDNGIFWIEAGDCKQGLAVCYPFIDELSDAARQLGELEAQDAKQGIDHSHGYLFFSEQASCIPLFELLESRSPLPEVCPVDQAALVNAIYHFYPDYIIRYNFDEQAGRHNYFAGLLRELGMQSSYESSSQKTLALSLEAGRQFIRF